MWFGQKVPTIASPKSFVQKRVLIPGRKKGAENPLLKKNPYEPWLVFVPYSERDENPLKQYAPLQDADRRKQAVLNAR